MHPLKTDSKLVAAIGAAVAGLPTYSPFIRADAPPEASEVGMRYSRYSEDSLDASRVILALVNATTSTSLNFGWRPRWGAVGR